MEHKNNQIPDLGLQFNHQDHGFSEILRRIIHGDWKDVINILKSSYFMAHVGTQQETTTHVPSILHVACSMSTVPLDVIDGIVCVYGNSCCEIHDEDGNLPIHVACSTPGISASVICKLLVSCPSTSFARSEFDGETPLELLLKQGSHGLQMFNAILNDLPRSCFIEEEKGTSIFHEVCTDCIPESLMIQILELHPDIAFFQDSAHGNSIAHMICSQRHGTASMLRTVLSTYKDLASVKDNYGNLPLHVVNSDHHSEEMIQILLSAYPQGILSINKDMKTPYSSRLMCASPKKIRALLNYSNPVMRDESLSTRNVAEMLPIETSLLHMQHYLSSKCNNSQVEITSDVLKSIHQKDIYLQNMVDSIMILLHATCEKSDGQFSQHHASFWLSYPLITKLIIQQYPQLLTQYDSIGNLPLHILAKSDLGQMSRILCKSCHDEINSGIFFWLQENHYCTKCNCRWKNERVTTIQLPLIGYQGHGILKEIMTSYPDAIRSVDAAGNLPLHLSLRSGKSWFQDGVKNLVDIAPETIYKRDNEGIPPVMLAAHKCDLSSIYLLLRESPDCISR